MHVRESVHAFSQARAWPWVPVRDFVGRSSSSDPGPEAEATTRSHIYYSVYVMRTVPLRVNALVQHTTGNQYLAALLSGRSQEKPEKV